MIKPEHRIGGLELGCDVVIEQGAIIEVKEGFIGDRSIIRSGAVIRGTRVILGTESYLDHGALIGGGSCYESESSLEAGAWLHMGWNSQINIARRVDIGEEVGIGIETKIFTHGAYLPFDCGFPVQWGPVSIGSRVWLPNAWINPNVTIGDNVVIAARSLVNNHIPSGCLAGGTPAKVLKKNIYPSVINTTSIFNIITDYLPCKIAMNIDGWIVNLENTTFDLGKRTITGKVTIESERVKELLRRNGVRFKFTGCKGEYVPWKE